jgi:hypothetical protein
MDSSGQAPRTDGVRPATEQNAQDARERLVRPAANEERRGRDDTREIGLGTVRLPDSLQTTSPAGARPATTFAAKTPEQTMIMVADDSKVVRVKTGRLLVQCA